MDRINQRQGFLVSVTVHLVFLMALASRPPAPRAAHKPTPIPLGERRETVFLPPAEVLRQLLPPSVQPKRVPRPPPTPAPAHRKDAISIGPESRGWTAKPILRRDDDLSAEQKGTPHANPSPQPTPPPPAPAETSRAAEGLRLPPGLGNGPARGADGSRGKPAGPSIASSLQKLERRLQETGPRGAPSGTTQQLGALQFDPEGVDFTPWAQHLTNEVYRNWIIPEAALMGFSGHVDILFVVERDGTMSSITVLKSTGTPALDRAAVNALRGSRPLPLPADYAHESVSIEVSFVYQRGPQGS